MSGIHYIYLFVEYHLNIKNKLQTSAFLRGMNDIFPITWMRMFSPTELQLLISGDTCDIDIEDWRANTVYKNGYTDHHQIIRWFWSVMAELPQESRSAVLRFSTSSSRPPLLGFRVLEPRFTIRAVDAHNRDGDGSTRLSSWSETFADIGRRWSGKATTANLPSAATCFNVLKLPRYSSKSELKQKLLQAVTTATGFYEQ